MNSNAPTPLLLPTSLHGASPGILHSEAAGMPRLSFHDQSGHCTEAGFLQTRYLIYFYYPEEAFAASALSVLHFQTDDISVQE